MPVIPLGNEKSHPSTTSEKTGHFAATCSSCYAPPTQHVDVQWRELFCSHHFPLRAAGRLVWGRPIFGKIRGLVRLGGNPAGKSPGTLLPDETDGYGVAGEAGGVVDVQFGHQAAPVFLHRFDADAERGGALFVGFPFRDQLQDFHFPGSQSREGIVPCGLGMEMTVATCLGGADAEFSAAGLTDGFAEIKE